jgi:hypothetical protein
MNSTRLKKKLKDQSIRNEDFRIRIHRSISWLSCAEKLPNELDLKYLALWISFNSCYAIDLTEKNQKSEKEKFRKFISTLVKNDHETRISNLLWNKFSGPIRILISNQYVFNCYWDYQRGERLEWENAHKISINAANKYLANNNTVGLLEIILDRLYVLRNQIMHGGATYKSKINRSQIADGTRIIEMLIPVIIDIMLQNPDEDWGRILYPVVK